MEGPTLAEMLRDATPQDPAVPAEVDLDTAKRLVEGWLDHLRRTVAGLHPSDRHTTAVQVLERSSAGVLVAVRSSPAPAPPPAESGWRERLGLRGSPAEAPPPEPARVLVDRRVLFDQLVHTAERVDDLMAVAVAPEPVRETLAWADDQELLAQLWPLLGALATENGDAALTHLRKLERTLRLHHGIEMRVADEAATAEDFDLHPGDEDRYVTVTPALIVRGRLWRRGEARRPKADTAGTADTDGARSAAERGAAR